MSDVDFIGQTPIFFDLLTKRGEKLYRECPNQGGFGWCTCDLCNTAWALSAAINPYFRAEVTS